MANRQISIVFLHTNKKQLEIEMRKNISIYNGIKKKYLGKILKYVQDLYIEL